MLINTPSRLETFLESRGYVPHLSEETLIIHVTVTDAPYTVVFSFDADQLRITCQIALLGEFPALRVSELCLAALDANMHLSPYAFAVIGASEGEVDIERCPLVLTDVLLTSDLNEEEIAFSIDKLLEAIIYSHEILKLGFAHTPSVR